MRTSSGIAAIPSLRSYGKRSSGLVAAAVTTYNAVAAEMLKVCFRVVHTFGVSPEGVHDKDPNRKASAPPAFNVVTGSPNYPVAASSVVRLPPDAFTFTNIMTGSFV